MSSQSWNPKLYESCHSFVWERGASLLALLDPKQGERILDLGCGTRQLTAEIASMGAVASGIDASVAMIEQAQQNYPNLRFEVCNALTFEVSKPLDAVFSNATLHWIKDADTVIERIYRALRPGGRLVAEFGGKGNVQAITQAIFSTLETMGHPTPQALNPWYFPTVGEYATCLERQGFEVSYAVLFDRPTPLEGGQAGMANWLRMFGGSFWGELSADSQQQAIQAIEHQLYPILYQEGWIADYRRLRLIAIKP